MAEQNLVYIPVTDIHPRPDNPRKDVGDVAELDMQEGSHEVFKGAAQCGKSQ